MLRGLLVLLFAGSCGLTHFDDGSGGGPGTGGRTDAAPETVDGGTQDGRVSGTLCLISDLADRAPCTPLLDSGLTVRAESAFVVVEGDGSFDLPGPGRSGSLVVSADGNVALAPAAVLIPLNGSGGAQGVAIPVIHTSDLDNIIAGSGASAGGTIIVIRADTQANTPANGVAMATIEGIEPLYDSANRNVYLPGMATSIRGAGVYFNVVPQAPGYAVTVSAGNFSGTVAVSAVPDAINIATVIVAN